MRAGIAASLAGAALAASVVAGGADLDPDQARRVELGVGWFRGMLTADVDIEKKGLADGRLLVVFVYTDDERRARSLADAFASAAPIRKHPVVAEIVGASTELAAYARRNPAGIFLAQAPPTRSLKSILSFARDRSVLVYSPFEGHVEEGVPGGLAVEAQVRPYINARALADSRITLKEIFLQASKVLP